MKTISKIILLMSFLGLFSVACNKCENSCCGESGFNGSDFRILEMGIKTIEVETKEEVDTNKRYFAYDIVKAISVTGTEDVVVNVPVHQSLFGFMNNAIACSPSPRKGVQVLDSIILIAVHRDYTPYYGFEKGDTLEGLFGITLNIGNSYFQSISSFLRDQDEPLGLYENYFLRVQKGVSGADVDISVTIHFVFNDGSKFTFENEKFKLE